MPTRQMPLPCGAQLSEAFCVPGRITVADPAPRSVSPDVVTLTLSWYVPAVTSTVSPGFAAFTAFWIDCPERTTCSVGMFIGAAAPTAVAARTAADATQAK
ncbi:hypothetical protein GCM10010389_33060 [Streptomyces echinoruber]|uniref:Uncharacterized protein n=1 Tax=Streptomyces echinoruber TaxID=68898 RepID=A0A918RCD0_9ACTN|nr:hypothetical protein GCM10010389_33060 [Streptomyces echinoruber]